MMRVFVIRKSHVIAVLSVLFLLSAMYVRYERAVETMTFPILNKVVVIDPGHGGVDGGASSRDGTTEAEINLKIALKLRDYIEASGGVAILTRDKDEGLYTEKSTTIRQKKNEDLVNRKRIIDSSNADIFLSIHLNSFTQSQYYGAQVFYPKGHEDSILPSKTIQEELRLGLDKNNRRQANQNQRDLLLMKNVKMPTVLIECGFLSNDNEAQLLKTAKYQDKIAYSIYVGLVKYFAQQSSSQNN